MVSLKRVYANVSTLTKRWNAFVPKNYYNAFVNRFFDRDLNEITQETDFVYSDASQCSKELEFIFLNYLRNLVFKQSKDGNTIIQPPEKERRIAFRGIGKAVSKASKGIEKSGKEAEKIIKEIVEKRDVISKAVTPILKQGLNMTIQDAKIVRDDAKALIKNVLKGKDIGTIIKDGVKELKHDMANVFKDVSHTLHNASKAINYIVFDDYVERMKNVKSVKEMFREIFSQQPYYVNKDRFMILIFCENVVKFGRKYSGYNEIKEKYQDFAYNIYTLYNLNVPQVTKSYNVIEKKPHSKKTVIKVQQYNIDQFNMTVRDNKYFDYPFRPTDFSMLNPGLNDLNNSKLPSNIKSSCDQGILVTNETLLKDLDNLQFRCLSPTSARKSSNYVNQRIDIGKNIIEVVNSNILPPLLDIQTVIPDASLNTSSPIQKNESSPPYVNKTLVENDIENNQQAYLNQLKQFFINVKYQIGNMTQNNKNLNKTIRNCSGTTDSNQNYIELTHDLFPDSLDYARTGILNEEVYDQQECGSCWAFSVAGMLESRRSFLNSKKPISLSRQFLLDCVTPGNCNGGHHIHGLQYAKDHPLALEKDYPYKRQKGRCLLLNGTSSIISSFDSFQVHKHLTAPELKYLLLKGPVAVEIDAKRFEFVFYSDGVVTVDGCGTPNHSMLLYGWGWDSTAEQKYWILRNSWGKDWGLNGNVKMALNDKNGCGIYRNVAELK